METDPKDEIETTTAEETIDQSGECNHQMSLISRKCELCGATNPDQKPIK